MHKLAPLAAVTIMLGFASNGWGQQSNSTSPSATTSTQTSSSSAAVPQDSLAEAARKAREQKKEEHKTPRLFTNDDLPTSGGISTIGQAPAPAPAPAPAGSATPDGQKPGASTAASSGNNEASWREKFATLRHKLEQDQQNLDLLQRELGTLNTQFYGDPNKQLEQQLTRSDIDKKTAEIDKAKDQVAADQKAIDDAETDLRTSGGDPGWAR